MSQLQNKKLPHGYNLLQSFFRTIKQVRDPIGSMEESMQRFNGTYAVNLGMQRLIATEDPAFIDYVLRTNQRNYQKSMILTEQLGRFLGKGLLTSNGEFWLRQRRLIQPGFHVEKLHKLYDIMKKTVDEFLSGMSSGANIDVYPLMNRLAFQIVINTLFNVEIKEETRNALSSFISDTQDFVIKDVRQPYNRWWFQLSGEVSKNLQRAREARDIIRGMIRQRKDSGMRMDDLLDMLLDARYEDTGEAMGEEQMIDEIMVLLIAGHETTANALSFALYLLAEHPLVMNELREQTGGLSLDQVVKNRQLAAVINETMRLYPPAWISDRVAVQDDTFNDFFIPSQTIIVLFYYGLHRSPVYWQDPLAFKPQRFLNEKEKHKAYYPFGGGPRLCIGNNFAMAEMAIFLNAFLQQFALTSSGKIPTLKPLVTLRPDNVFININRIN